MTGLLIIIVCAAIAVFCYKQVSKRCGKKSQGKFRTFLTSTLSGIGVFIITMLIAVPVFIPMLTMYLLILILTQ